MRRVLVAIGLVATLVTGTWAGTIRSHIWGYPQREIDPNLLAALMQQVADPNVELRVKAIEEFTRLGTVKAIEAIAGRLNDKAVVQTDAGKVTVAAVACASLGLLRDRQAAPYLIPLLEDREMGEITCRALSLLSGGRPTGVLRIADVLKGGVRPDGQGGASDLHDPVLGCDPVQWKAWWTWEGLAGREIMVRVYNDATNYELVKAKTTRDHIPLTAISGTDPCSIVVICGQDQQEEDLRVMMGPCVVARCVCDGKSMPVPNRMWQQPGMSSTSDRWTFEDALGNPIADLSVEVWLSRWDKMGKARRIRLTQQVVPENGMEAIQTSGSFGLHFVVSHPVYGKANAYIGPRYPGQICVPLVPLGSEASSRAIVGTVVDELGQAVPDARIECSDVRTFGDDLIRPNIRAVRCEAIADANGFFALYMVPGGQNAELRSVLIPPRARYQVIVTPPASTGLLAFEGSVENGAPARIVLERPGGKSRTFMFEAQQGFEQDPNWLKGVTIQVTRPDRPLLKYPYSMWSTGCAMPEGTYILAHVPRDRVARQFEPLEVNDASPDVLVFRLTPGVTYRGRVVDAKTGLPVPGAFVLAQKGGGRGRFSDFTDAQWSVLEQLDAHPSVDEEALKPVREVYGFLDVVRADANGRYEVRLGAGTDIYALVVFGRDYIPVQYRTVRLERDAFGRAEAPEIRLYPAARVSILVQVALERARIDARWCFKEDQVPAWARDLCAERADRWLTLEYSYGYAPNVAQWVFVPADVPVQLLTQGSALALHVSTSHLSGSRRGNGPGALHVGRGHAGDGAGRGSSRSASGRNYCREASGRCYEYNERNR